MAIIRCSHCRPKRQEIRFVPYYLLTATREKWDPLTSPKRWKFAAEAEARAHLSALQRRKSRGGRVLAKLEYRDRNGIWHVLPLDGGAK